MMKLKKLKLVAVALAMASLGSCGMKEGSQKNSKIKDFYNKDANESVYRVRPVDENPIYVLGNWLNLAVGGYDGFAWAEKTNEYLLITGDRKSVV